MTESRPELGELLAELYDDPRRTSKAPSTEEILAFLDGELSPAEEEDLQERLSLHPEATQLLLDLADPARLEGTDDADLPLPDTVALRQRLRGEGVLRSLAPVVPIRTGVHPVYRWAAAALLLISTGLAIQLVRRPAGAPASDVALWELLPREESGRRDAGEVVDAETGFSHDLVLYANEITAGSVYRLVVFDQDGHERLEREARTKAAGRIVLRLQAGDLEPGRYEIHLLAGDGSRSLAVYSLDWRRP